MSSCPTGIANYGGGVVGHKSQQCSLVCPSMSIRLLAAQEKGTTSRADEGIGLVKESRWLKCLTTTLAVPTPIPGALTTQVNNNTRSSKEGIAVVE
ncbi:hypothetical protein AMTR_s00027p00235810 [Amborella trichopoda]|uniref:Uncharacterized protein n=1 Tax=Amborella trichopoda TaxID=13333 RepID=W1PLE0_AMBTC|nr:hypothetical protein AMTR_s00027p00235810 [Amborella trichopoda]